MPVLSQKNGIRRRRREPVVEYLGFEESKNDAKGEATLVFLVNGKKVWVHKHLESSSNPFNKGGKEIYYVAETVEDGIIAEGRPSALKQKLRWFLKWSKN